MTISIAANTSIGEIAALVSEALQAAGIEAILSGGAAVAHYSHNAYMSADLDFVTSVRNKTIRPVLAQLGFEPRGREFVHPASPYFVEFPPGPLAFGNQFVDNADAATVETQHGSVRIITPTQCVMDRLAWFFHSTDRQARDQAIMVAQRQQIDWQAIETWARLEGISNQTIAAFRNDVERAGTAEHRIP